MREIRFRGKRLDNGEWIYGSYTHCKDENGQPTIIPFGDNRFFSVDPATVGQYTGLKDMNGVEIYEGDILRTDLSRPYLVVEFRNGAFMYQCHDSGKDYYDLMMPIDSAETQDQHLEIIGNIHDKQELIKE